MSLELVSLIVFVAIVVVVGAVALVVRDLFAPRAATTGGLTLGRPLRRRPNVFDETEARSLLGRMDQGFDRLVLETGFELTPYAAFLVLLASGLLIGGMLWIYTENVLAGLAGGILGMIIPLIVMSVYRARRMRAIREQLPQVLDLLARAVRAGASVDGAILLAGNEAGGVLGREFRNCSRQIEMGRSLPSVMQTFAARIRVVELRILATVLAVQRQTGGNLAETLERMSGVIRDRLWAQRQMKAATGAGRASALLIATICPIAWVIMFLWQPEHVRILLEDPLGQMLFIAAIVLEIVGIIWVVALLKQDS